ncbi:MAG: LysM peptidoglycan-binding domain-containing protein, partial [Chloroflexota bacterium]
DATPTATAPAGSDLNVEPYEPPVIGQGGTCIAGSVIDIYHNLIPADLNISVTPKAGGGPITLKVDSTGHFQFLNLGAGTYTVNIEVREGWVAITAPIFDVILNGSSSDCADVRAKFELPGCFIVSALNYDKTNQIVGLPERTITITNGNSKISKKTDMNGRAEFPNVLKGNWTIAEGLNEGWAPVRSIIYKEENNNLVSSFLYEPFYEPSINEPLKRYQRQPTQEIFLSLQTKQNWWELPVQLAESFEGDNRNVFTLQVEPAPYPQKNQDPAFCQPISIVEEQVKGSVLIQKLALTDKGENPAPGWTMKLHNSDGTQPSPDDKVTGSDGTACFPNLELGNWTTAEVAQDSWDQISAPTNPLNLATRWDCATLKYKNMTQVFKNGLKYGDILVQKLDLTGKGLQGWTINLDGENGEKLSGTTQADGKVCFEKLPLGSKWSASEVIQDGWVMVESPTNPITVSAQKCANMEALKFINARKGKIVVQKLDDKGKPLAGWTINLSGANSEQRSGVTQADGKACFENLLVGSKWILTEEQRSGWKNIKIPGEITVADDQSCDQKKAEEVVNQPISCIDGYKINDLEQPLADWTIQAVNTDTKESSAAVLTDINGYFKIDGLPTGNWEVSETLKTDWEAVTPGKLNVSLNSNNAECAHVRFKNRFKYACVDVWKKDSFDGVGLPIWSVNLTPKWGGTSLQPSNTFGDGWVRFKVPAGDYVVSETPQTGWHAIGSSSFDVTLQASGTCGVVTFCNLQDNMQLPANSLCNAGLSANLKASPAIQPTAIPTQAQNNTFLAPPNGCRQTYVVSSGDTFFDIATSFGLTITQLARVNPSVNPSIIYPNLSLCIP